MVMRGEVRVESQQPPRVAEAGEEADVDQAHEVLVEGRDADTVVVELESGVELVRGRVEGVGAQRREDEPARGGRPQPVGAQLCAEAVIGGLRALTPGSCLPSARLL